MSKGARFDVREVITGKMDGDQDDLRCGMGSQREEGIRTQDEIMFGIEEGPIAAGIQSLSSDSDGVPAVRTSDAETQEDRCLGLEHAEGRALSGQEGVINDIRGVVRGTVEIQNKRKDCGLVIGERIDWIWTARLLGYQPTYVVVRHHETEEHRKMLQKLLPSATVEVLNENASLQVKDTWFVDGFVDPQLIDHFWETASVVVTTKNRRRGGFGRGWHERRAQVAHADVGGVSDGYDRCFLWTKNHVDSPPEDVDVPHLPRRDVYSVASDTVGGAPAAPPEDVRLANPTVTALGRGFHGGGLYPLRRHNPLFRLASVFHHSRWCQRPLTWSEQACVFDVPLDVVAQFGGGPGVRALCIHPSKGLEHCARALLRSANLHCGGQDVPTIASELHATRGRTPRPEDIVGTKRLNRLEPRTDLSPSLRSRSKKPFQIGDDTSRSTAGTRAEVRDAVQGKQEDRNAKATKDDDAQVPVVLWRTALLEGLAQSPYVRGYTEERVEAALNVLRSWGLRIFNRNVTRSFSRYTMSLLPDGFKSTRRDVRYEWSYTGPAPQNKTCWTTRFDSADPKILPLARYRWTKHGVHDYRAWWKEHWGGLEDDIVPGRDAIVRAAESSWWEWEVGSSPFYWRWPEMYLSVIRDGLDVWMPGPAPRFLRPQQAAKDPDTRAKIIKKINKVRKRKYIAPQRVVSLTDFFHVDKGETDIRMVYNGTSSGLNDALWVPSFPLPTVEGLLRCVHPHSWMADTDLGEMFLNFHLHKKLRELAGVDLTHYLNAEEEAARGHGKNADGRSFYAVWEAWTRCAMGLKPSPYQTTQGMQYVEDVARGDRHDVDNVFHWDRVVTNLPGSSSYDPTMPWVYKVKEDGSPANDFLFYVDDNRTVGGTKSESWLAARRVASTCSYLGIQDAPRKRREPSQSPGAWAGAMVSTDGEGVYIATSEEKWKKAKGMISDLRTTVKETPDRIDRKDLERKRGFLLYVTRSYPSTVPYLKGIHLTLDGWRGGRNSEGWKMLGKEAREALLEAQEDEDEVRRDKEGWKYMGKEAREAQENGDEIRDVIDPRGPMFVKAQPRLQADLEALAILFDHDLPPLRRVRSKKVVEVYYGFGDASQDSFGFTFQHQEGDRVYYRYGQWCYTPRQASSNYRELLNLVETLETLVREDGLEGCEVFLFTDNSTAEAVYYKGNSSSATLFELMLRLRQLEMEGDLILHVIHVAGTRMMMEGADGTSRGDSSTGVMSGNNMLEYIPIHEGALEASPELKEWFNWWWDGERGPLRIMEPNDWFDRPFKGGNCLWVPAPAAAEAAVEQLGRIIHQHPYSCHLFVVPCLLTSRWRRKIGRLADFDCRIAAGARVWPKDRHEPLLIFCCLPLSSHPPWKLRRTPFVEKLEGSMRQVHSTHSRPRGRILRELFVSARKLDALQEGVVQGMLLRPAGLPVPNQARDG